MECLASGSREGLSVYTTVRMLPVRSNLRTALPRSSRPRHPLAGGPVGSRERSFVAVPGPELQGPADPHPARCAPHPYTGPQRRKQEIHPERKRGAGGPLAPSSCRDVPPAAPEQPSPTAGSGRSPCTGSGEPSVRTRHAPLSTSQRSLQLRASTPLLSAGLTHRESEAAAPSGALLRRVQPAELGCAAPCPALGRARAAAGRAELRRYKVGQQRGWEDAVLRPGEPRHRLRGARRIPAAGQSSSTGRITAAQPTNLRAHGDADRNADCRHPAGHGQHVQTQLPTPCPALQCVLSRTLANYLR